MSFTKSRSKSTTSERMHEISVSKIDSATKKVDSLNKKLDSTIQKVEYLNSLGIDLNAK